MDKGSPGMLIDIGANLTHESFRDDIDTVIQQAQEADVGILVVTGADEVHSREALELSRRYPGVLYGTAGIHPHYAVNCSDQTLAVLEGLAQQQGMVAVGECGLDFFRNFSPHADQEKWFAAQLELAQSLRMPVFLHQRDAHDKFLRILSRYRSGLVDAVAHCFTGTEDELRAYLELDLHIGITGWICDERRGRHLCNLARHIPLHRLMLETDAPYLLPRDLPQKPASRRNEPKYLAHIGRVVAACANIAEEELARATTATARAFFRLPEE